MTTSGVYRRDRDSQEGCDFCEWSGWVVVHEDFEDLTGWWTCPECAHQTQLDINEEAGRG